MGRAPLPWTGTTTVIITKGIEMDTITVIMALATIITIIIRMATDKGPWI
jgi:hypothetical protein